MEELKAGIDRKTYRLREESLARKRNQEYQKQLFWNDITNYYKTWNVQASKYNMWASQSPTRIDDSYDGCQQTKTMSLEERREKLSKLLTDEERHYADAMRVCGEYRTETTRELMTKTCKEVEKDNLKNILQGERCIETRKMSPRNPWKTVHPIVERMEKKKSQESMKICWIEQMKEKQLREENEKEITRKLEEESKRKLILEEEKEREFFNLKRDEMKQLRNYLLTQMDEIKKTDELSRKLKAQEQKEIRLKMELEEIASRRNQTERQRRTKEFRTFLRHQYQSQLKQKTKQIQEELIEDKRLIDEISQCLEREEKEISKVKEKTRKEIDRANVLLAEYTKLEKQREREMEFMFFEEARKMWQKQEAYWEAEKEARNELMRDVLVTIQQQVKENLQRSAEQHKALLEEKENILKKIEEVNNQLKTIEHEAAERKKEYMMDLKEQIKEKEQRKIYEKQKEEKEFRDEQTRLKLEEKRILGELCSFGT